jgi:hypothetical protein
LAELHLEDTPSLASNLLAMQSDPNFKVRYQLLCTLWYVKSTKAAEVRQKLLFRNIDNKWMQIAALSALSSHHSNEKLLTTLVKGFKPSYSSMVQRLSAMLAANQSPNTIHKLLRKATSLKTRKEWQGAMLQGIASGLGSREHMYTQVQKDQHQLVQAFFEHPLAEVRKGSLDVLQVIGLSGELRKKSINRAANIVKNRKLSSEQRVEALHFLTLVNPIEYASLI